MNKMILLKTFKVLRVNIFVRGVCLFLFAVLNQVRAQTNVSGVVNSYKQVSTVGASSVTLGATTAGATHTLIAGDKVILMEMNGPNMGVYEIKTVAGISGSTVSFTTPVNRTYSTGVKQLIWVPDATDVVVTGIVTPTPWNGTVGGVVALSGTNLTLNARIDASGAGFTRSAPPNAAKDGMSAIVDLSSAVTGSAHIASGAGGGGGIIGGGGGGGATAAKITIAGLNNTSSVSPTQATATAEGIGQAGTGGNFIAGKNGGVFGLIGNGGNAPFDVQNDDSKYAGAGGGGGGSYGAGGGTAGTTFSSAYAAGGGGGGSWTGGGLGGIGGTAYGNGQHANGLPGAEALSTAITDANHFLNNTNPKLMMGGAGGLGSGSPNTAGGTGGGIIFLDFDTITGNNYQIAANGSKGIGGNGYPSSGSGGGAGGQIYIKATTLSNATITANGGRGGPARAGTQHVGAPGGGGGGGGIWFDSPSLVTATNTATNKGDNSTVSTLPSIGSGVTWSVLGGAPVPDPWGTVTVAGVTYDFATWVTKYNAAGVYSRANGVTMGAALVATLPATTAALQAQFPELFQPNNPKNTGLGATSGLGGTGLVSLTGAPCVSPTFTLDQTAPTCASSIAQNNGKITLTVAADATKFGVSTGATYSGTPNYAAAMAIGTLPMDVQTAIPNTGGTYTIRFFNGADNCTKDTTITVAAVTCTATCSITVKPMVSGCYQNNGSKATVSVEVAWQNAPAGETITVTGPAGSVPATRTITPGSISVNYGFGATGSQTIVSPQVIAFEIPANGASGLSVSANFSTTTSCSVTSTTFSAPAACEPLVCGANQTGGSVFFDYNADGLKQTGETQGLEGVTVKAFDCNGALVSTTTTDFNGKYVFTGLAAGSYPIRVEFSNLPSIYGNGTVNGADGRTTVQFVTAADCNVDLGVLDPNDYCQTNPLVFVPCFVNGDPLAGGDAGTMDATVMFDYANTGLPNQTGGGYVAPSHIANAVQVGTLWGTAYNRFTKRIFQSAILKRHAGLGPDGIAAIYVTDLTNPASPVVSSFINVKNDLNIDVEDAGSPVLSNAARLLPANRTDASNDPSVISQIGKVGIGDIDLSEDGNMFWFVNVYDKKLYSVNISAYNADGTTKPTAADAIGYTIPNPGCVAGVARPFGLKIVDGSAYVGVVCDGSTSQNKSDLRAYVYKLTGSTWSTVFDFPLTYPKGPADTHPSVRAVTGWFPWTDDWSTYIATLRDMGGNIYSWTYPMPMLTDIEFDIDGSMILGFGDRAGLIGGSVNYAPTGNSPLYSTTSGGDFLRAYYSNGTYILENAAKAGPTTGSNPTNDQGPGFGEFYDENLTWSYNGGNMELAHAETALGALALRPGSGEIVTTAMDPVGGYNVPADWSSNPFDAGGIIKANNQTGVKNGGYMVYQGIRNKGLFGKSTGLGDIELGCSIPTYLELGNYVWNDANKNGVQDPCEKALKDINVTLYKGTTKIATTKTGTNGEYYFSSKSNLTTGTWEGTGADTTLLPNTAYKLVFGEGQLVGGKLTVAGLGQFDVTLKDATANNGNDQNDSDAEVISGAFCINLTTGNAGSANHTFDAGFYCTNPSIGANAFVITTAKCVFTTPQNNGKISLSSAIAPYDKYRTKTGTGAWSGDTTYATATAIGSTFPKDLVTGISNAGATYTIRFYNGECCYKDTTITIAPVACCVLPVASATPQKQTICVGGTASAFTATPSTGVEYKWYGPLTSTSGSLGTAISGATNATFTPTGTALTTSGTKYYAVVVNTTGDVTCADTAFVQLDVSKITVPAVTALCHANGTPEDGTDDYMTFSIHVSTEPMSTNKFTVTATQGGNPLAVTLSNGSAATSVNCGLNTPLRTPAGSAGKGNVTLTITDNVTGCSTTVVVTDPGTCAVTCVQGTPSTVTYEYGTQVDITELNSLPIIIPKFDEQGGTRVLTSVKLEYLVGGKTAFVFENSAAQSQSFNAKASSEATLTLDGTGIATNMLEMAVPQTTLPGGILVPATGNWAGDSIPSPVPTPTTLGRMESWVSDYLTVFKDPRVDARWVTNATGDATDDDDMYINPMIADSASGTFTYNTALALAPFIGTGNVPLEVSTLSGLSLTGGGGNLRALQRTRAYASAKVTYTFECILCTKPVALATPKVQTICVGSTATAYTATPSTGVEYKWYGPLADTTSSLGTAVSGATSATFTPSGAALTTAGTKYYAVVVNTTGDVTCADTAYVQLVVNAKPVIADGSATICAGELVDLTSKITNYDTYLSPVWTVGTAGGTAVATPSSVKPTGTTTYVLVAQNAAGCKDTANVVVTVNAKPNAGKDTTLACVNAATNTLATSYTLVPSPAGGSWSQLGTTPTTATISGNDVTGMSVAGTYQFIYTSVAGCKDTIAVTVAPCPVCVKPNAGADAASVCQPTSTAKLTAVTAGGTWAPIVSPANPSAATIDASGNISGLNAAGTYKFVYSVTSGGQTCTDTAQVVVLTKPVIADGSATICAGESVDLTTKITNYNTYLSPVWTVGTASGAVVATPNSVKPTGTTTYVLVAQNAAGCKDTANVVVTVNAKPSAGKDTTLACVNAATNTLATSYTLVPSPAGGTWSQLGTTPTTATITGNNVTGMTIAGTYQFIYTSTAGCKDTVAVTVAPCAGCVKPNAGPDAANVCQPIKTAKLTAVTAGGTWAPIGSPANPSASTIDASGNISGLNAVGTYRFVYSIMSGGQTCTDTAQVIVLAKPVIADGSATICAGESVDLTTKITNYDTYLSPVWTVGTANGTVVTTPASVKPTGTTTYVLVAQNAAGCKDTANVVVTVNAKPSAEKDTTLVCSNGNVPSSVQLSASPTGGTWSALTGNPTGATVSSSGLVSITNATAQGKSFNFVYSVNGCQDTVKVIVPTCPAPCIKSSISSAAPVCSNDAQTYSFTFTVTNKLGIVKVNKGTLSGNNPYTVSGIPSGQSVIITDSLSAICKADTTIAGVNCNCNPALPQLLTPSLTACIGDTFPTLKATVVGLATVEWFSQQTGGTVLARGLSFKPSGTVTANTVFYAQARSTDPTCPTAVSTSRVPATINAQSCIDTIDLALKKSINTKIARVGDVLTYTIKVWNEWTKNATGVEVVDSIATTVQFVSGSFVASRGSATISGNVIKWNIGNIAAAGDTVTLRYQVRATQAGIHLNTAEISKTNEKDKDSTSGNGKGGEDDIDQQCFTVPFELCAGQKLEVSVPSTLTNVQWFKNGGTTAVATGNVVLFSEVGVYTFTATNQTCPANGCCPVIIEAGANCCPVDLCIPYTVKKVKK